MTVMHILMGVAIIAAGGVLGAMMDLLYNVKQRSLYWGVGAITGVIGNAVMLWPLLAHP